jgi:TolB-like protein/Tfp pilus assembly protein PilF
VNPKKFFAELKRRNVYKVAIAYAVVTWLLIQIATQTFPFFEIPSWGVRLVVALLLIGFPIAMLLAWAYELTPEGIKRTEDVDPKKSIRRLTGRKLDFLIIGVLVLVIAGLLFQRYRPTHATSGRPERSVAVLPLENLSKEEDNAFFADGILDDILSALSKIKELKVIRRTSVMAYRNPATRNLREIGLALGVANVLEGSVRRVGNRVLVNVELVDVRNDQQLWSERYDRTLADSLTLQGEVATEIASALRATLSPQEKASVGAKPTENAEAYVSYLRAHEYETRQEGQLRDVQTAVHLYENAIALDPSFALAHARLSLTLVRLYYFEPTDAYAVKGRAEAEEALRLRPNLGEAHTALGNVFYLVDGNHERALEEFGIAARALPNDAEIILRFAALRRRQGRWKEAMAGIQKAQAIDPQNPAPAPDLAFIYCSLRDWPAATQALDRLVTLAPDSVANQILRAYVDQRSRGDTARAKALLKNVPGRGAEDLLAWARWDISLMERDFAAAEQIVSASQIDPLPDGWGPPLPKSYLQGCVGLARGESARALVLFEEARPIFEGYVRAAPQNAVRHAQLGVLYAFMGRKEDAIREGRRAVELNPEATDAVLGPLMSSALALIYARTGESDQALALIQHLLATPGCINYDLTITLPDLRLRWYWDPLRKDPRFQKILNEPEPKTVYK